MIEFLGRRMIQCWIVAGLVGVLAGCGGQTPRALSLTGGDLAAMDLGSMLIHDEDVPDSWTLTPSLVQDLAFDLQLKTDSADATLNYMVGNKDAPRVNRLTLITGKVTVWVYADSRPLNSIYAQAIPFLGLTPHTVGTLGEQSSMRIHTTTSVSNTQLLYVRCHALVYVQGLSEDDGASTMLERWAEKIDQRIQSSTLCVGKTPPGPSGQQAPRSRI